MATSFSLRGRIALIRITRPPVNSLGLAVRKGIADGLDQAEAAKATAVVISGDGSTFPAGADIAEFAAGNALAEPSLPQLVRRLTGLKMHTVAAIHGTALGGGMEVTLACQYRLMHAGAKVGLPEVHLGILPGAGGTQLLPRIVGAEMAISLMTTGRMIDAKAALAAKLVDEIIPAGEGSLADAVAERGYAFAKALGDVAVDERRVLPNRHVTMPDGTDVAAFFAGAREQVAKSSKGEVAPLAIVGCVEAAVSAGSFEKGMEHEATAFIKLASGPQAPAMQHVFAAERMIGKIRALQGVAPAPVRKAAVVGAGTMGGGIAMCFAQGGIDVTIIDRSEEALANGLAIVRANWEASARKGKLSEKRVAEYMGRLRTTTAYTDEGVTDADVVVEAAFERMAIKKEIFGALDTHCKPGALLATNTSTLDIDEIASSTRRPEAVVGMHFFSPANVMPLLENVAGAASSPQALATAMALGKQLRKKTVLARNCFGFIGNRMLEPYVREALYMLEEGATPAQVDAPLREFGLAMGPFQMSDLAGNDIGYNIRRDNGWTAATVNGRYWAGLADQLVEMGRLGQKTKRGWYDYSGGRTPVNDPEVEAMIVAHSAKLGRARRVLEPCEIVDRALLSMANEGFKIVEEGIAQRESDVDIVDIYGYGYPRRQGGPLYWARHGREGGLAKMVEDLRKYAAAHPDVPHWKPSALLLREAGFDDAPAAKL